MSIVDFLRQLPYFEALPEDELDAICGNARELLIARGDALLEEGKPSDAMYVVVDGEFEVTRRSGERQVAIGSARRGEVLGEMSVLSGLPRTATVRVARGSCTTYVISGDRFRSLVRSMRLERLLWEHIVRRQQESEALRTEMAKLGSRRRLAETMLRLAGPAAPAGDGTVELHLTQREVGEAVGRSLSWVQTEIRRLREAGVVSTGRRKLLIHGADRLRGALADDPDGRNG
jgi:CRP/FNR family transcriptional regulator, cyclic AMP receptor protein